MKRLGIGSPDLAVAVFDDGRVAWSMTPEFERRIWEIIKYDSLDDMVFDGLAAARRQAGIEA